MAGELSEYFEGIAAKTISAVEADPDVSNQHEFNGDRTLQSLFGRVDHLEVDTQYILFEEEGIKASTKDTLTWYNARKNHPVRNEWRLYYRRNEVTEKMAPNDTLIIAKRKDGSAVLMVLPHETTIESQYKWLFGVDNLSISSFVPANPSLLNRNTLTPLTNDFLAEIGIGVTENKKIDYGALMDRFQGVFPSTMEFSTFARESLGDLNFSENPDQALIEWIAREEDYFKFLEKHVIAERLKSGFVTGDTVDVESFISFSLSIQNRRKSRAGRAVENHLEYILHQQGIEYSRTPLLEDGSRPDFLFPGVFEYQHFDVYSQCLVMLGVKSTCKDRWRQVLDEAKNIEEKHLLTLDQALSVNQVRSMKTRNLQLVIPKELHTSYSKEVTSYLMSVKDFICLVKEKSEFRKKLLY